jgi:hypothetical protein
METLPAHPGPATQRRLTPSVLRHDFGARAAVAHEIVQALHAAIVSSQQAALAEWKTLFGKWAGRTIDKLPRELAKLTRRYGIGPVAAAPEAPLFALQTYYALLVTLIARRFAEGRVDDLLPESPFSWCLTAHSEPIGRLIVRLTDAIRAYQSPNLASLADDDCDLFKPLYQDIFPRSLRHQLGEYYTPGWLARHVLDQVGYDGHPDTRLLDPACGSGTFLLLALRRWRQGVKGGQWAVDSRQLKEGISPQISSRALVDPTDRTDPSGSSTAHSPLSTLHYPPPIVGFDLNPLAVLTARANYLLAIADLLPELGHVEIPVYLCDSILGVPAPPCAAAPFDVVVGNPPWIAWDNLSDDDRRATKPLWERYGLFSLSGNEARHGGGKKDLSMLMLYAVADRYLRSGGRLGMVITQTLFQTKGAGDGFRRFRLGPDGDPLKVLRVDDMAALRPFGDAANWTSTIVLEKGAVTEYPVPYFKWDENGGTDDAGRKARDESPNPQSPIPNPQPLSPSLHPSSFIVHPLTARPIDPARPGSPWLVLSKEPSAVPSVGRSDYTAHLGANSGGANGVYWVEVLNVDHKGGALIRNVASRGKHPIDSMEHAIELDLLCPLLRWSDVRRFSAVPRGHILLTQDTDKRTGIAEDVMHRQYPRTLAYLRSFCDLLTARAAYRRYQQRAPFYSMYNVGPYTVAPVKVVWRRMDRQINAAVVEEADDRWLGRRPVIPQETCVLVACESADEAHYICAALNSAVVNDLVLGHSVRGGKGFGTPGMLEFVPVRRFQPDNPRHAELAALSRQAHAMLLALPLGGSRSESNQRAAAMTAEIQHRIDCLTAELWALPETTSS